MNSEIFKESKNVFITFTGGAGGHHISNMLSLCDEFEPKFVSTHYFMNMLTHYSNKTKRMTEIDPDALSSHFYHPVGSSLPPKIDYEFLMDETNHSSLLSNKKKNILIGHYPQWEELYRLELLDNFVNNVWIVCSLPSEGTLASRRLEKSGYGFPPKNFYTIPYSYDHLGNIVTEDSAFLFDTDTLFTDQGSQYLRECVAENFGITLPPEADLLHAEWMKWMHYLNDAVFPK